MANISDDCDASVANSLAEKLDLNQRLLIQQQKCMVSWFSRLYRKISDLERKIENCSVQSNRNPLPSGNHFVVLPVTANNSASPGVVVTNSSSPHQSHTHRGGGGLSLSPRPTATATAGGGNFQFLHPVSTNSIVSSAEISANRTSAMSVLANLTANQSSVVGMPSRHQSSSSSPFGAAVVDPSTAKSRSPSYQRPGRKRKRPETAKSSSPQLIGHRDASGSSVDQQQTAFSEFEVASEEQTNSEPNNDLLQLGDIQKLEEEELRGDDPVRAADLLELGDGDGDDDGTSGSRPSPEVVLLDDDDDNCVASPSERPEPSVSAAAVSQVDSTSLQDWRDWQCRKCGALIKARLLYHCTKHSDVEPYKCRFCDYKCKHRQVVKNHQTRTHKSSEPPLQIMSDEEILNISRKLAQECFPNQTQLVLGLHTLKEYRNPKSV